MKSFGRVLGKRRNVIWTTANFEAKVAEANKENQTARVLR